MDDALRLRKYRLIDMPISNCLNSGLRHIFVLTQFNSESLNTYIAMTYKFDVFSSGYVTVLAAEQNDEGGDWFQGTADAVRQGLRHMQRSPSRDVMVLSGDQLYSMDFRQMLRTHRESGADATVAVIHVAEDQASGFGIVKMDGTECSRARSGMAIAWKSHRGKGKYVDDKVHIERPGRQGMKEWLKEERDDVVFADGIR